MIPGCTGAAVPVLLYLGPRQWVPPDLHGSPGPAQDSVHDTLRLVWIHKDADGPGVSPCHLPASDAGNHVRLCLSVSARLPRRPPCLLQDVRRTHGAPGTTPAAGDRDRSETESQQVPVPEAWSHLSWPHDLGWWSELRVWQGGVCTELANTNNNNRAAQLSWLCQLLPAVHQRVCQDCRAAPWPGERRSQALQEEGSWCIQALGSQTPRGLRILEGGYNNSSCSWLRWLHQALHFGDGCQPWWAQRHPVPGTGWEVKSACLCQPMPPAQWKKSSLYSSMKLEFLVMKWVITDKFRHYLFGGKFKVITDNNLLTLGALDQRWASQFAQFDFDIQYRPGKINPADALPRMPLEPSPEPLLTVVPPEVASVNDLQCEQLAVDPTPTAGVLDDTTAPVLPLDKEEEPDQTAVPEAATEVLPRLSMADLQQLQQRDPVLGPVLAAWPAKPSDTKERSMRALVQQYPRLFLKKGGLHRRQADQRRGTLEQLVLPSSLRPDVLASLHDDMGHQGCHVSGKTSVLAVRCCYFVTNNNGHPSLTHTCMQSLSNHTRHALTHALWVIHSRTRSLSRNIICISQLWYFIQFTIVILTTATLLHAINVNPGATK